MKKLFSITCLILFLASVSFADEQPQKEGEITKYLHANDLKTYKQLQELTNFKVASSGFEDFPMSSDIVNTSYRSPGKSFLYSLMVPGAGQIYTGSKFRAGIYMGIEAAAWIGYIVYHGKGKTQEKSNNQFVDKNWDYNQYQDWLIEELGITSDTMQYLNDKGDLTSFTHHLPTYRTQQFYEMVGKYDQFRYGWTDTDYSRDDSTSALRTSYLNDRATANSEFTKAKTGAIVAIVNHLFSAFDGALSARSYNKKQDTFSQISIKARMVKWHGEQIPKLTLTYKF